MRLGTLRLTSNPLAENLVAGGLALAIAGNCVVSKWFSRGASVRRSCRNWAGVHGLLLVFHLLLFAEILGFGWLRDALVGIRDWL
jgi:hypothetical protein